MAKYVDGDLLSGVSSAVLVGRDLVDVHCAGFADIEAKTPMVVDHNFRVFSNSKLVTSMAALMLYEEGRFDLTVPLRNICLNWATAKYCARMRRIPMIGKWWQRPSRSAI